MAKLFDDSDEEMEQIDSKLSLNEEFKN